MTQPHLSDPRIAAVTHKVVEAAKVSLGDKLDKVYLFGSYARGDYNEESDINFFIIAHVSQEEASTERSKMRNMLPNIDLEYDINVSLRMTGSEVFYRYIDILPLYKSVLSEGIVVSD